jgi:hypothetical protein
MLGNEGARIAQSVNALTLSAAIVHASELIDRKIESDRRVTADNKTPQLM